MSAPSDAALTEDQYQQLCDEACATVQQLSRSELQNLVDDSDAFNRVVSDLEKVPVFHVYYSSSSTHTQTHTCARLTALCPGLPR